MTPTPPRKFFGKNGPRSASGKASYGRARISVDKHGKKLLGGKYLPEPRESVQAEAGHVVDRLIG